MKMNCTRLTATLGLSWFAFGLLFAAPARSAVTYVKSWGSFGTSGSNVFNNPQGIAVNSAGQVYVVDSGNFRVQRFDSNGGYQIAFGSAGNGQNGSFGGPAGDAVNAAGQVYVVDYANSTVEWFNANGGFLGWSPMGLNPTFVAIAPAGNFYVASAYNNSVYRFDNNNNFITYFGSAGTANGQFNNPNGVAVNAAGQLYVVDNNNNRVERFDNVGTFQTAFGVSGTGSGQFNHPIGIATSATGLVYVADTFNNRIERFDANGNFQISFGSAGGGAGQMTSPYGVAVGATGEIYVVDNGHNRVEKWFDPTEWVSGTPTFDTASIGTGQVLGSSVTLDATHGLAVSGLLTINAGGALTQGVAASFGGLSNNGYYALNTTTLTLTGGSLTNNGSVSINAGIVNGNVVNGFGATMSPGGAAFNGNLVNNGDLTPSGQLVLSGSLTNNGLVSVNPGGAIVASGSGAFMNAASGILRGDGAVTMTLTNSGGLIHANGTAGLTLSSFAGNFNGGELRVADGDVMTLYGSPAPTISNSATINLTGSNAVLNGDLIANYGTLHGQGRVGNAITNFGVIRADGGSLVLAGAPLNNVGTIQSAAGTGIVASQGLGLNSGIIALTGGSFDNSGRALINNIAASIVGNGTFSAGTLSNYGTVTFSDGASSIFGSVNNVSAGTLHTIGAPATIVSFYGAVTNSASSGGVGGGPAGYIKISGNAVRWLGGLTNNGIYVSDPADNYFTGLAVGTGGLLQGGDGDRFFVTSPFTNAGQIDLGGSSQIVVDNGAGLYLQTGGNLELGASATLSAGTIAINGGTFMADGQGSLVTASLAYASSQASTYQGILAGPGTTVNVDNANSLLVLSGTSNSYGGGTFVTAGVLAISGRGAIPDGSNLTVGNVTAFAAATVPEAAAVPVPEPAALTLLVAVGALAWLLPRGRERHYAENR
jgi:DNA-binding beta-propeller fold protein YncE